jgi:hypothetical protein
MGLPILREAPQLVVYLSVANIALGGNVKPAPEKDMP